MPTRPGVIVSSWEVVAKVKEAERKSHNLSVWQFEQLASHQNMDKSNLVVQFERTKSRGKEEAEGEEDGKWKRKKPWNIRVVSTRRPFLVLVLLRSQVRLLRPFAVAAVRFILMMSMRLEQATLPA